MHLAHDYLRGMADGPRLLYRSSHIYLLWSSLLNLLLGCYFIRRTRGVAAYVQMFASVAVLSGPILLAFSFLAESNAVDLSRPVARVAILLATVGVVVHALTTWLSRERA